MAIFRWQIMYNNTSLLCFVDVGPKKKANSVVFVRKRQKNLKQASTVVEACLRVFFSMFSVFCALLVVFCMCVSEV